METFGTDDMKNKFAKSGQATLDKAADRVQGGIKDVQQATSAAGAALSSKVDGIRSNAGPALDKVADQAREYASQASDSVISFTRDNPIKALMIAAASGALLLTLIKALTPNRD